MYHRNAMGKCFVEIVFLIHNLENKVLKVEKKERKLYRCKANLKELFSQN